MVVCNVEIIDNYTHFYMFIHIYVMNCCTFVDVNTIFNQNIHTFYNSIAVLVVFGVSVNRAWCLKSGLSTWDIKLLIKY